MNEEGRGTNGRAMQNHQNMEREEVVIDIDQRV
jgi:hypothetical protein